MRHIACLNHSLWAAKACSFYAHTGRHSEPARELSKFPDVSGIHPTARLFNCISFGRLLRLCGPPPQAKILPISENSLATDQIEVEIEPNSYSLCLLLAYQIWTDDIVSSIRETQSQTHKPPILLFSSGLCAAAPLCIPFQTFQHFTITSFLILSGFAEGRGGGSKMNYTGENFLLMSPIFPFVFTFMSFLIHYPNGSSLPG